MQSANGNLLEVILDSWDRNNRILVNLLGAVPPGGLSARVLANSASVAEMFTHIHYVRLIFLSEDVDGFHATLPAREWVNDSDPERIAGDLNSSAEAVRNAVRSCVDNARPMKVHYDHPLLLLQHMIWHEGYHHGQIKLALKSNGQLLEDEMIGPLTWDLWMNKNPKL